MYEFSCEAQHYALVVEVGYRADGSVIGEVRPSPLKFKPVTPDSMIEVFSDLVCDPAS